MEFAVLAQYFEKLEQTSSRLSLIAILSELFSLIKSPDEIEKVCYLVQRWARWMCNINMMAFAHRYRNSLA
jgi:hypothetical protein